MLCIRRVKLSAISIPAAAFGINSHCIKSTSSSREYYAPVNLPNGAKITEIGFIGWKQSWSHCDTTLTLKGIDSWVTPNNHVINEIGVVSTAVPPTAMQDYYSVSIDKYIVDNDQQAYFLVLSLPADAPGYPGANDFYHAKIVYVL